MGNPMCDLPANAYTVKIKGGTTSKPRVPVSKAVIGKMNCKKFMAIDPSATPVSAYTKKIK